MKGKTVDRRLTQMRELTIDMVVLEQREKRL